MVQHTLTHPELKCLSPSFLSQSSKLGSTKAASKRSSVKPLSSQPDSAPVTGPAPHRQTTAAGWFVSSLHWEHLILHHSVIDQLVRRIISDSSLQLINISDFSNVTSLI